MTSQDIENCYKTLENGSGISSNGFFDNREKQLVAILLVDSVSYCLLKLDRTLCTRRDSWTNTSQALETRRGYRQMMGQRDMWRGGYSHEAVVSALERSAGG